MSGVDSIITQSFDGLFRNSILEVLKAIVPAMSISTNLFSSGTESVWEAVLFIAESLVSIAVVLVAYSLFTGIPFNGRPGSSRQLSRLLVSVVLMPFTLYFAQLVLNFNDALTSFVLPYGQLAGYSSQVAAELGGYSVGALIVIGIVTLLLYLVLIVRTLLVFFTAALLPLALLCVSVNRTRQFSTRIMGLFFEMAFLPFFMAVGLRIGIATSSSTFSSLQVPPLIIAGTYLLPLLAPFIISPVGSRILQYAGMPALGSFIAAASLAGAGAVSYAAGFASSPLRLSGSNSVAQGGGNGRAKAFGLTRSPSRSFAAGRRHGSAVAGRVAGGGARLRSRVSGDAGGGRSHSIQDSYPVPSEAVSGHGHHKIYVGVKKNG